ncbi:MAG: MFS transporter [Promethearchaeota archaeon]|nr:MAG: MFS transporter [Candidatus Lokiarchaeota archaeon]
MNSEKLGRNIVSSIALVSLAGNIAWAVENQYYNVFLYNALSPNPIYISIMVALTTIVGTISTIIMGSFSDVRAKRRPFILYGLIFWAITTAIFPLSAFFLPLGVEFAVFIAILFDCIMTFFGATSLNAGLNAYITDSTSLENRGKAMGISQMMNLISLIIIYGAAGFIINAVGYYVFFYIVGGLVALIGIAGGILVKDSDLLNPLDVGTFQNIKNTFKRTHLSTHKNFFIVLVVLCVWQIGFNVFFPYILIYLQHYLGFSITVASILVLIPFLVSIIMAYPLGILTDKLGRKKTTLISTFTFFTFAFLFGLFTDILLISIMGTLWLLSYTSISVATFSWAKDLYPDEGRGQFSGYWNLFSGTIPMIIGPFIGGWLASQFGISAIINDQPGYIPTPIIFFVGAILILFTLIPLYFAKEKKQ